MIRNTKEKTVRPSSFISSFTGYIDHIFETVESEHKSLKMAKTLDAKTINRIRMQTRKNSESLSLLKDQLNKWRQGIQSQSQQQLILALEQKLSKATRLNAELYDLVI